jgi:hypothetical protein
MALINAGYECIGRLAARKDIRFYTGIIKRPGLRRGVFDFAPAPFAVRVLICH